MTLRLAFVCILPACVAACGSEQCFQQELKYYDEALSRQLTSNGIAHVVKADRGVCVASKYGSQLDSARRQVDSYFHEVADLLADACEERAFSEWATREGLRFEIRSTVSSQGPPERRMFLLRSYSQEEVAMNRRRLSDDAPKGASCRGK